MENLKEMPFNQPIDGIPVPSVTRSTSSAFEDLLVGMKVGQCLRVQDRKELKRALYYLRKNQIPVVTRSLGDGSYVIWRRRKNGKSA